MNNKLDITLPQQEDTVQKIRALPRRDGRMTSVRLDILTWEAIEHVAAKAGQSWQEWANCVLEANPDTVNMAGALRRAVIHQLMHDHAEVGTVDLPASHQIAGKSYKRMSDAETERFLKDAHVIHEDRRFTIFSVVIGFHGPSQAPFVCIKNQLLGGLNLLLGEDHREH